MPESSASFRWTGCWSLPGQDGRPRALGVVPASKYAKEFAGSAAGVSVRDVRIAAYSMPWARQDVVVTGDIGCYSLGAFKPLNRLDIILCMGGGISMAQGLDKAGRTARSSASSATRPSSIPASPAFWISPTTRDNQRIIVVDNRTTAMTGHQEHPGTGKTLMGEPTDEVSIEEIARACGMKRVRTINPYDPKKTLEVLPGTGGPGAFADRIPCGLSAVGKKKSRRSGHQRGRCKACELCLELGCPAIDGGEKKPHINVSATAAVYASRSALPAPSGR